MSATTHAFRAALRGAVAAPEARASRAGALAARLIPAGAGLAALVIQLARPTNPDVSWLLTVNERILAGATPYRDVVELNPPASILLYRLPALIGRLLGARPEWVVAAMVALLVAGALAYARNFIPRYRLSGSADDAIFLIVAALVLAVLPFDELAQRDHVATLLMLPFALVGIARLAGRQVGPADALLAGVTLGLAVAIKPHFGLCALLVGGFTAWRLRDLRAPLRIEYWTAGAVVLAYLAGAAMFFPLFFSDVLPKLADVYLPLRLDMPTLVRRIATLVALPLALCWICRDRRSNAAISILLLVGAGFVGAYLAQGKGWSYHAYPAAAFFLIAAGWAAQQAARDAKGWPRRLGALLLAAALILPAPRFVRADVSDPALAAAILRLAPHPRILAIAFALNFGHPLSRDIGGVWVGRTWGLWETGGALYMKAHAGNDPARLARADAYFDDDRLGAAADIETRRPDIVLIQKTAGFDFAQWIEGSPPLRAAMSLYRRADTVGEVEIYQRRDEGAEPGDRTGLSAP